MDRLLIDKEIKFIERDISFRDVNYAHEDSHLRGRDEKIDKAMRHFILPMQIRDKNE